MPSDPALQPTAQGRRGSSEAGSVSEPAALWHGEPGRDVLTDLTDFCRSLDWYEIPIDLTTDAGVEVRLLSGGYMIGQSSEGIALTCPKHGTNRFDGAEGTTGTRAARPARLNAASLAGRGRRERTRHDATLHRSSRAADVPR